MTTELIRIGCIFYEDLSAELGLGSALISDRFLTEDEFVARYTKIIQLRYATVIRLDLSSDEASFFASCIWHYLKTLETVDGQIPKVSPCCLQQIFRETIGLLHPDCLQAKRYRPPDRRLLGVAWHGHHRLPWVGRRVILNLSAIK